MTTPRDFSVAGCPSVSLPPTSLDAALAQPVVLAALTAATNGYAELADVIGAAQALARRNRHGLWLCVGTWSETTRPIWLVPLQVTDDGEAVRRAGPARGFGPADIAIAPEPSQAELARLVHDAALRHVEIRPTLQLIAVAAPPQSAVAELDHMAARPCASDVPAVAATPLDADGSQRLVIARALVGDSFNVMAPPGSGATQTITNIAGLAAAQGARVVVTSDHAQSLVDARARLAAAGLACEPRDGKAYRPSTAMRAPTERVAELTHRADALHQAHHTIHPAGLSVAAVLDELIGLRGAPRLGRAAVAATTATADELAQIDACLRAAERAGAAVTPVESHPWRVSNLTQWLPTARERTSDAIAHVGRAAFEVRHALTQLTDALPGLPMVAPEQFATLADWLRLALTTPRPGAELLAAALQPIVARRQAGAAPGAAEIPRDAAAYVALLAQRAEIRAQLSERWHASPAAGRETESVAARFLRWQGRGVLGSLMLRNDRRQLRRRAIGHRLPADDLVAHDLALATEERHVTKLLTEAHHAAIRWFGELCISDPLDVPLSALTSALDWARGLRQGLDKLGWPASTRDAVWRSMVSHVTTASASTSEEPDDFPDRARAALTAMARFTEAASEFAMVTGVDVVALWRHGDASWPGLPALLASWSGAIDELARWVDFGAALTDLRAAGLDRVAEQLAAGELAPDRLRDAWRRTFLLAWLEARLTDTPSLVSFVGDEARADGAALCELLGLASSAERSRIQRALAGPDAGSITVVPCAELAAAGDADLYLIDAAHACAQLPALIARGKQIIFFGDPLVGNESPWVRATAAWPTEALLWQHRAQHEALWSAARRIVTDPCLHVPSVRPAADVVQRVATSSADDEVAQIVAQLALTPSAIVMAFSSPQLARLRVAALRHPELARAFVRGDLVIDHPRQLAGVTRAQALVSLADAVIGDESGTDTAAMGPPTPVDIWLTATCVSQSLMYFAPLTLPLAGQLALLWAGDDGALGAATTTPVSPLLTQLTAGLAERNIQYKLGHGVGAGAAALVVCAAEQPDLPILAIELDDTGSGLTSAVDRERTRPQLLAQRGLRVHRLWRLEWFADPAHELARVATAVMSASAAHRAAQRPAATISRNTRTPAPRLAEGSGRTRAIGAAVTDSTRPMERNAPAGAGPAVVTYAFATVPSGRRRASDLFELRYVPEIIKLVERVVHVEAPICLDALARRIAPYFGMSTINPRAAAYLRALVSERFFVSDDVVWQSNGDATQYRTVRVPSTSEARRSLDEIPLPELAAAVSVARARHPDGTDEDVVRQAARLLGWGRIGDKAVQRGLLALRGLPT